MSLGALVSRMTHGSMFAICSVFSIQANGNDGMDFNDCVHSSNEHYMFIAFFLFLFSSE